MDPLVLTSSPAAVLLWVTLAAWGIAELITSRRRGGGGPGSDPSYTAMAAGIAVGVASAAALARWDWARLPGGRTWPVAVGLVLVWSAIALRAWAIRTLGRFFTYAVQVTGDQHVIQSGPYGLARHPSYTGLLVGMLGLGIALDSWLSVLGALLFPLAGVLARIRVEESALSGRLGEEYRAYAARTKRLVPGVW